MKKLSLAFLAAFGVGACAHMNVALVETVLGPSPALSGGSFTSGGGITVATEVRERDGQTMVCGAWAQSKAQSVLTKHLARDTVSKGYVRLGNETLVNGLQFMAEVEPTDDYGGAQANCVVTDRPWLAGDDTRKLTTRIPTHVVYKDPDELFGGVVVYFRPGAPGAGDGS